MDCLFRFNNLKRGLYCSLLCFCLFGVTTTYAQNITYAHKIIDTLTSDYFAGRGAVNGGEKKAAKYIVNQFKEHDLKPLSNSFFQEFNYPINTFPKALSVSFDNVSFKAGKDYIVDAASGEIRGTFQLLWYNKDNVPTKKQLKKLVKVDFFTNKFIVIDAKGVSKDNESFRALKLNTVAAAGIIFLEDKLTQHLSSTYNDFGVLHVLREHLTRSYKEITLELDQKLIRDYQSQNVVGCVEGTEYPDSFIVLSAHYDHLGMMGSEVYFPGANDNASGVAMLLDFAAHYTQNKPKKTIVFIAFGAEEAGLIGSKYFVENPLIHLSKINFVFNMDLMGTGSKGATIVNGAVFKNNFNKLVDINTQHKYLPVVKIRGKAANSDHYWFSEKGVPAFFMYLMGGPNAYHDVDDVAKTLPLTKYEDTFRLIRDFVNEL